MNVLMINGSPRVNGNTAIALREMEQIFKLEGIDCECVQIGMQDVRGCIACGSCAKKGKCVFDDVVNELAPKFEQEVERAASAPQQQEQRRLPAQIRQVRL